MTGGFVKLYRCALDSWLWRMPAEQRVVALTILLAVNWRDGVTVLGGRRIPVPRGAMATTLPELAARSGVSERTVRTAVKNLEELGFLTGRATNKFRVITVVNYDTYQARDDESDRQNVSQLPGNRQAERHPIARQSPGNRQTHYIEEEDQEGKEGEEREEEHKEPAVAGRVHAQAGLFAESAQEPRQAPEVDRDTRPDESEALTRSGATTEVVARVVAETEAWRRREQERRRGSAWGDELAARRKRIGITTDELAKFLSVGGRKIAAWEKGAAPGPEEAAQCLARLAEIEARIGELAAAAVGEINAVSGRDFKADSDKAIEGARQAWRWGWEVDRFRAVVRLICDGLRDFQDGAKVRPATVFQTQRLRNAADELDAGAVPRNGRQPLKGAALLNEIGAAADEMRRMGYGQRKELQ